MGPNGSGKSTLAQVLAGRDSYTVDAAASTWDGRDLLALEHRGAGPRRPVPRLPVSGRDSGRLQRLLPEGGGQRRAPPSRPARVRCDGLPGARQERDEGGRHEGGVPLSRGQRRLFRRREEAQRDPADGAARAQAGDPRRDRLGPGHRRAAHRRRRRQPAAQPRAFPDRHHPLPAPAGLHRSGPGPCAGRGPHRALRRPRTRARTGRARLRVDRQQGRRPPPFAPALRWTPERRR